MIVCLWTQIALDSQSTVLDRKTCRIYPQKLIRGLSSWKRMVRIHRVLPDLVFSTRCCFSAMSSISARFPSRRSRPSGSRMNLGPYQRSGGLSYFLESQDSRCSQKALWKADLPFFIPKASNLQCLQYQLRPQYPKSKMDGGFIQSLLIQCSRRDDAPPQCRQYEHICRPGEVCHQDHGRAWALSRLKSIVVSLENSILSDL